MLWKIRTYISILLLMLVVTSLFARNYTGQLYFEIKSKQLYRDGLLDSKSEMNRNAPSMETQLVFLYFQEKPNSALLYQLHDMNVEVFEGSWRPANERHPWGFYTARIPATLDMLKMLEADDRIVQIRSAEGLMKLNNDRARLETGAEVLQGESYGLDGSGVRIGIIDSGFEIASLDLSQPEYGIDYSAYPDSDFTVSNANTGTGHGTHVAGSILGLGTNSNGVWRGMAPGADWVALKVAADFTHVITEAAVAQSYWAAWNQYDCDMTNASLGGWDDYHDGSGAVAQIIDQISMDGCVVFQSSGNEADDNKHASGTLSGGGSEFVAVNIPDTTESTRGTYFFNLVWYDGSDTSIQRPMTYSFYDENMNPISNLLQDVDSMTQSPRGTQARWGSVIRTGSSSFYIKVENLSGMTMDYHLFSMGGGGKFSNPDSCYTVSAPADADFAVSVGAWTVRNDWNTWNHLYCWTEDVIGEYGTFSSRGPRIDGVQKPELSAPGNYIASIRDDDAWGFPYIGVTTLVVSNAYAEGDSTGGLPADYVLLRGTSMASPVACGAAALIKQFVPDISRTELVVLLQNHARMDQFTGDVPNPKFGYGKIDVEAALLSLIGDQTPGQVQNVSIALEGSNIVLSWEPVSQSIGGGPITPDSYVVYGAYDPNILTWSVAAETSATSCSIPLTSGYRFFRITCINNP